jgi:hypothetical protein
MRGGANTVVIKAVKKDGKASNKDMECFTVYYIQYSTLYSYMEEGWGTNKSKEDKRSISVYFRAEDFLSSHKTDYIVSRFGRFYIVDMSRIFPSILFAHQYIQRASFFSFSLQLLI